MDWRLKGAIDRALGLMPGGRRLRARMELRSVDMGALCDLQVADWQAIMSRVRAADIALAGAIVVELGTGTCPTVPLCMYLGGAAKVFTFDRERRAEPQLICELADRMQAHLALIARESGRPLAEVEGLQCALTHAVGRGVPLMEATGSIVDYRAPAEPSATSLSDASVDVVVSRSLLEHEPPHALAAGFAEARRILRPGGLIVHTIDCADHYATTDRRRGPLDYLALSDAEWARWNTAFLYQNRLRAKDFTTLACEAGFTVELAQARRRASLEGIAPAPRFAQYSPDELAITSFDLVGRKP